ncbi:hypothetical protein BGZ61DRAFT_445591 [Ilyonectria robusta]|uniref:uncharacterized protein n=1 Tax=Ilyonectria robusta TaxID=1079257 RepID=UPI001E8E06F3|nr:uncharacterized protein BGZ61DRAFT_445591 [Ilyonectria robusta]KAH8733959.1 hypothetical protein BGZ61DRAFT_445591 [Ilyonectria robusta]
MRRSGSAKVIRRICGPEGLDRVPPVVCERRLLRLRKGYPSRPRRCRRVTPDGSMGPAMEKGCQDLETASDRRPELPAFIESCPAPALAAPASLARGHALSPESRWIGPARSQRRCHRNHTMSCWRLLRLTWAPNNRCARCAPGPCSCSSLPPHCHAVGQPGASAYSAF